MSDPTSVENRIRRHITTHFVSNTPAVDEELNLDSLNVLKMVSFVEEEFGIAVEDEELVPENFATIASIRDLVESKITAS